MHHAVKVLPHNWGLIKNHGERESRMDDNEKIYHASGACIQPLTWGWIHAPYYHLDGKRQIILWKLFARKFCIINNHSLIFFTSGFGTNFVSPKGSVDLLEFNHGLSLQIIRFGFGSLFLVLLCNRCDGHDMWLKVALGQFSVLFCAYEYYMKILPHLFD